MHSFACDDHTAVVPLARGASLGRSIDPGPHLRLGWGAQIDVEIELKSNPRFLHCRYAPPFSLSPFPFRPLCPCLSPPPVLLVFSLFAMSLEQSDPPGPPLVILVVLAAAAGAMFWLWLSEIRERSRIRRERLQRQQYITAIASVVSAAFLPWPRSPDRNWDDRTEQAEQAERARRRVQREQQAADDAAISMGMGSNKPLRAAAAPGLPPAEQEDRRTGQPSAAVNSSSSSGGSHRRLPDPPVDTSGRWVPRAEFNGKKSFGWFQCDCGHYWQSAHAMKDKWQRCTACSRKDYAELMWLNASSVRRTSNSHVREDNGKPHRQDLCQVCIELGVGCWTVQRDSSRSYSS
jgi:hypothetical protein